MEKKNNILIDNRKANYNYFLLEKYVAGIRTLGLHMETMTPRGTGSSFSPREN